MIPVWPTIATNVHTTVRIPARFGCVFLQSRLHLVVREEGHVARVGDGQHVPVTQQVTPRLEQPRTHNTGIQCL